MSVIKGIKSVAFKNTRYSNFVLPLVQSYTKLETVILRRRE